MIGESKQDVVYVAGPMTGRPLWNFPMFDKVTELLRQGGSEVISPAEEDRVQGFDPVLDPGAVPSETFMERARQWDAEQILTKATCILMLPGWENSRGARAEKALAEWKGIPVMYWVDDEEQCYDVPISTTRPSPFTEDAATRKTYPVYSGCINYFPRALAEIAHISFVGNEQHNPGTPLHWDRTKSQDEPDAMMRHVIDNAIVVATTGKPSIEELAKIAWRALANLEKTLEERA